MKVRHVLRLNWTLIRSVCLLAIALAPLRTVCAQEVAIDTRAVADQVASATQPGLAEPAVNSSNGVDPKPEACEPYQLPNEHHPWASFRPGAWRELQIVTETFDEAGQLTSRNITTQREILEAVADGKFSLKVQATVDLGTKRIVGAWKTRVLDLATDRDHHSPSRRPAATACGTYLRVPSLGTELRRQWAATSGRGLLRSGALSVCAAT